MVHAAAASATPRPGRPSRSEARAAKWHTRRCHLDFVAGRCTAKWHTRRVPFGALATPRAPARAQMQRQLTSVPLDRRALQFEQRPLAPEPTAVAGERASGTHDAMAGDDDRHGRPAHSRRHAAHDVGPADGARRARRSRASRHTGSLATAPRCDARMRCRRARARARSCAARLRSTARAARRPGPAGSGSAILLGEIACAARGRPVPPAVRAPTQGQRAERALVDIPEAAHAAPSRCSSTVLASRPPRVAAEAAAAAQHAMAGHDDRHRVGGQRRARGARRAGAAGARRDVAIGGRLAVRDLGRRAQHLAPEAAREAPVEWDRRTPGGCRRSTRPARACVCVERAARGAQHARPRRARRAAAAPRPRPRRAVRRARGPRASRRRRSCRAASHGARRRRRSAPSARPRRRGRGASAPRRRERGLQPRAGTAPVSVFSLSLLMLCETRRAP